MSDKLLINITSKTEKKLRVTNYKFLLQILLTWIFKLNKHKNLSSRAFQIDQFITLKQKISF